MKKQLAPGSLVTWMHTPPGGYGYQMPIPARVVHVAKKRVTILVETKGGQTVRRHVKPESLKLREENG